MNNIFNLIDEMEGYFDTCKKVPISNKLMVDIEVIYEFMTDLRLKLPEEIKKAERVLDEREKILSEASQAANSAEKDAELRVTKLVNDHEIVQKAYVEAEVVMDEAKNTAKEMKLGAYEYVDELIAQLEVAVKDTLQQSNQHFEKFEEYMQRQLVALENNRQELQVRRTGKKR
ncbi:MAG: ATPase [Firmicutes bacterium HGW-Firmicutes-1]|nr:MAG: ATPase [Firmicutes bacterium HGW-Firmicutes-1]